MMKKTITQFPVTFSLLVFGITMPVLWGAVYPLLTRLPFYWEETVKYGLTFCMTILLCLAVYHEMSFLRCGGGFFKGLFTFGMLGIVCAVMAFVFSYHEPDRIPSVATVVGFVLYNLAIAVSEECLFRGLILNVLLEGRKGRKGFVWFSVIVSSAIFGFRHFLNLITTPETVVSTTGQVFFTFMAGFYLCAVYLRTGNMGICIFIHFWEDFFTGFWDIVSASAAAAQKTDGDVVGTILLVAVHSIYVVFGILMLKGYHQADKLSCRKEEII